MRNYGHSDFYGYTFRHLPIATPIPTARYCRARSSLKSIITQYQQETIRLMYLQFIEPSSKRYTDIIVPR